MFTWMSLSERAVHETEFRIDTGTIHSCFLRKILSTLLRRIFSVHYRKYCKKILLPGYCEQLFEADRSHNDIYTSVKQVGNLFFDCCIVPFAVCGSLLADNTTQFVNTFFGSVTKQLGFKNHVNKAYQPRTSRETELVIKAIVTRLKNNVFKNQRSRDMFVQPFSSSYNILVHRSTNE